MKILAHISGGYDSAAAVLRVLIESNVDRCYGFFSSYGVEYEAKEQKAAEWFGRFLKQRFGARFRGLLTARCDMMRSLPPEFEGVPAAYVPIRNLVINAQAANWAQSLGLQFVIVGTKSAECVQYSNYAFRDTGIEFYHKLEAVIDHVSEDSRLHIRFDAPLSRPEPWPKEKVLTYLHTQGVDLRRLWNCYGVAPMPCGTCYHCIEMRESLQKADLWETYKLWWTHHQLPDEA